MAGHSKTMGPVAVANFGFANARPQRRHAELRAVLSFDEVYKEWFDFVWRSARRLGASDAIVDDAVQDVFLVVHRRLHDFEGRSSIKTWLFGITMRVVKDYRRASRRRGISEPLPAALVDPARRSPLEELAKSEACALLHSMLEELDDDKRPVFVLAELEQMTVPEIAKVLGKNTNTVYSRLRAARAEFNAAVKRHHARSERRSA